MNIKTKLLINKIQIAMIKKYFSPPELKQQNSQILMPRMLNIFRLHQLQLLMHYRFDFMEFSNNN